MFRCLPEFANCFNYVYDRNSTEGIFIFHGFPSQKNRNKDLAHELYQKTNASIFVHHYEGLGESLGQFHFKNTVSNAASYVQHIKKEFGLRRLHFLGHSWGGYVTLNLLLKFHSDHHSDVGSIVLYSPYTQLPDENHLNELAAIVIEDNPHLFFHQTQDQVRNEFSEMRKSTDYLNELDRLNWSGPTLVLQAKNDASTPAEKTKLILPLLGNNLTYQELEVDHSFTEKRQNTFDLTIDFYKQLNLNRG